MLQSKGRSWKLLSTALVALLSISLIAGCSKNNNNNSENSSNSAGNGKSDNTVVATYEGGQITAAQFDREQRVMVLLSPEMEQYMQQDEFRESLLKQEIAYEYLSAKADDKAREAAAKQADSQLAQFKTQMGEDAFKDMLKSGNVTEKEFKDYMTNVLTVIQDQTIK